MSKCTPQAHAPRRESVGDTLNISIQRAVFNAAESLRDRHACRRTHQPRQWRQCVTVDMRGLVFSGGRVHLLAPLGVAAV